MSKNVAHNVAKEKTTTEIMFLMKKLFHLKMDEGAGVAAHVNEFNTIVNQRTSVKIEFDNEVRALILLASLPKADVSNSVISKLKFNDVRDRILAEKVRMIDSGEFASS